MAKDNNTGKDKEFYDLGKKMFDHIRVIKAKAEPKMINHLEDEAFEEIERKQQQGKAHSIRARAHVKAEQFIANSDAGDLGHMTLQHAYSSGYRAAMYDKEEDNGH